MTLVERLWLASEERGVDGITAPLLREAAARIEELKRQLRIARRVIEKLDGEGGQKQVRIRALEARIEELERQRDNAQQSERVERERRTAAVYVEIQNRDARIAALEEAADEVVRTRYEPGSWGHEAALNGLNKLLPKPYTASACSQHSSTFSEEKQ